MAIYHLSTKNIGRSGGRSATASAAYRAGEKIKDERQNMTFNYQSRTQSVDHAEILSPDSAPDWAGHRAQLWNAVETCEKRKDARVAREVEIALPRELTPEQNIELVKDFAMLAFVHRGMVADVCIHDAKGDNPHAHIMLTTRHLSPAGFGQKNREWNKDELLEGWRKEWEQTCNKHLERHHHKERIDHRSLEAQGIDRTPQKHLGIEAKGIERRTGTPSHNRTKDIMRQTAQDALEHIREQQREKARQAEIIRQQEQKKGRGFSYER